MQAKTWSPLSAREIVRVTESPGVLIVQSAQQLADVVSDFLTVAKAGAQGGGH
jgi:hypothetical protein